MIINLTEKRENQGARIKLDVVKADDFFASVDNIPKEPKVEVKPVAVVVPEPQSAQAKKEAFVHPSWAAKRNNEKLTGSIANQSFEGSRVVFEDDDE